MSVLCKPESHSSCQFHKPLFLILYIVPVETVLLFSISSILIAACRTNTATRYVPYLYCPQVSHHVVIVSHCRNPPLQLQLRSPPRCSFQPMLMQILPQPNHIFKAINSSLLSISSCSYRSVTEFPWEWHSCIN